MEKIYEILKPLKFKLTLEKMLNFIIAFLSAACFLSAALLVLSKFIYMENAAAYVLGVIIVSIVAAVMWALFKRPDYKQTACICDGMGFKERFSTSIEIGSADDAISRMVVNDAVNAAANMPVAKMYKMNFGRKNLTVLALALVVMLVSGFMPSPVQSKLEEEKKLSEEKNERIEQAQKTAEELLKEVTPKQAEEIKKIAEELKKDLKAAKNEADMVKASKKAQEKIMELSKKTVEKDMKALGESLKNHEMTKDLGEALERNEYDEINKQLEQLKEMLEDLSEEELKELAEIFEQAANDISEDSQLRADLQNLNEALNSGSLSAIENNLTAMNQTLNSLAGQNAELRQALENYNKAISQGQNASQQSSGQQGDKGEQGESGEGEGQGEGQGQGQGQGQGEGQGGGQGQTQGGSGWGSGHTELEENYSREAIYMPDNEVNIAGNQNDGGKMSEQEVSRIGEAGNMVPYDNVIGDYKESAMNSLEDSPIPYGLKEIVKEYFSSLE